MTVPAVSFVVPARNEAGYLDAALSSIESQETDRRYEVVVADGGSTDGTADVARDHGATVVREGGHSIASGRNRGAEVAAGEWLAFVDADTTVAPEYLERMLSFVDREGLTAATSNCRITGPRRAKLVEWTINHAFPRLSVPILPGFNTFVRRDAFESVGGFPEVPNEDTAFSRTIGRSEPTGYCPATLVESSGRRVAESGLSGTLYHYLRLDVGRLRRGHSGPTGSGTDAE
ncbi:glycosyltransferase [Natronomonas marina]|uniref:glycosyltransferase n=1 Tax=Natronomonas marina TaxID=2961939 RepID=UPI0020C9A202|nr:glycosyltransferase [Natronomonas marina]